MERCEGNQPKVTSQCQKEKQNEALGWMVASASLCQQPPLQPRLIDTPALGTLFQRPDTDEDGSFKTKLARNPQISCPSFHFVMQMFIGL